MTVDNYPEKVTITKRRDDFAAFWLKLEAILLSQPSTATVFNQYRDCNDQVDGPEAAAIRRDNLRKYMAKATESASFLVVGEAAGPWGCRFSGVPFTGERQLLDTSFPLSGHRSSKRNPNRATKVNPPFVSRSAEVFWEVMLPYRCDFVLWDAFPLHSHQPGDALTVRNPTKGEVSQFAEVLYLIKAYVVPKQTIAVGRKAFDELEALGQAPKYVRHPSRGGKREFAIGMEQLFKAQIQEH
jgi:hypothetical protein